MKEERVEGKGREESEGGWEERETEGEKRRRGAKHGVERGLS